MGNSNSAEQDATYLADLVIEETSGVNGPANLHEGWLVLKSREPLDDETLAAVLSEGERIAKHDQGALSHTDPGAPGAQVTQGPTGTYKGTDYAECVRVSVEKDGLSPEEAATFCKVATSGGATEQPTGGKPVTKSAEEYEAVIKSLSDKVEELQAAARGEKVDPVLKALQDHEVPVEIQKAILDGQNRAAEAERIAKAERDLRVEAEWTEVAKAYRPLSVKPDEFGPVLKRIWSGESTPEDAASVIEVLKASEAALRNSDLFKEVGTARAPEAIEASGKLESIAKSIQTEQNVPYEVALMKALETPEGRELHREAREEV